MSALGRTADAAASGGGGGGETAAKISISMDEWNQRQAMVDIPKSELNQLVMNYLVVEGFKNAAEKFARETGIQPDVELTFIDERMKIRNAIQHGEISKAISLINNLNPDILECNPQLSFHLLQQQLIEYIRMGDIATALDFAQEELAPRGESNPEFLTELEQTMMLFALDPKSNKLSLAPLMDPFHRVRTANEVNAALLASMAQEKDSKLPSILKLLGWAQKQLSEKCTFPKIVDYINARYE